ncbi:MAG: dTDP-4-dehydrorhamnose reductase [Thermoleophilia bacterium]|nr:dTDP-4-dehydrorhamnose reductase [Thermoleophilia bacterium]
MARVCIVGSDGQLGFDLSREFKSAGHDVTDWTHADIEITDRASVTAAFAAAAPEVVVNTAALNVETSELDPAKAFAINALGARELAAAAARDVRLVQISTDYVFDGTKGTPYVETDITGPLNAYGVSKLAGEHFVLAADGRNIVIRSSGLYGEHGCKAKNGMNFVTTMLALAADRDQLSVVNDEALSPTFTRDLATQIVALVDRSELSGIFHATAHGGPTWFEFASAIFELADVQIDVWPTSGAEYSKEADNSILRPANTSLENARLSKAGVDLMRPWRDQLADYLVAIGRRGGGEQSTVDR